MLIDREKIQQAKILLGNENAFIIAKELQLENFDEKNLKSLCKWHDEKTGSFIYNPKNYSFHCFGCGRNTDIIDAFIYNGETYVTAVQKLFELAKLEYSFGEHKVKTKYQYVYPKEVICDNKDKVYDYWKLRKISKETIDYADVRQDENGNTVFNYYDTNDTLTMVKIRPSRKINKGENKCWCQKGASTSNLLFNMNRVNIDKPLLIAEGEGEVLSAIESGYTNAVSVPLGAGNLNWIEENWDFLEQFNNIIICADNDEAGAKMQKESLYRLGSWRTKFIEVPSSVKTEDGKRVKTKDLGEILFYCGKESVMELIMSAKDSPVTGVSDISDIEDLDLDKIDGIKTGFAELDKELIKLFESTLTIFTGSPGSGKTSILYQIICQALDQNRNCFLFSKELPEWMSRNWLNSIMAGRRNITKFTSKDGVEYYKVNKDAKQLIGDYYKGKWFVYKNDQSNKLDDIMIAMEECIRKYGVKLLVIDNLMSIDMGATSDNEFLKQTDVINRLLWLAMKYFVSIILVAHPRKLQTGEEVELYSISGSANIINLANRAISLRRVTKKEKENGIKYDVFVKPIKDRVLGRIGSDIGLFYDDESRRFYSNPEEFDFKYRWDRNNYVDKLPYPLEDYTEEVFGKNE